jgi:hypothetical protein
MTGIVCGEVAHVAYPNLGRHFHDLASAIACGQEISQGKFSESGVTATIPAGLAQLRQRVAPNSLRLRGSEFVAPAQGKFRGAQGIRKVGHGIGDSAVIRMPMSAVGLPSVALSLTGRNLMAK